MTRVWAMRLTSAQKLILLCLAEHAHHDGTGAYPSVRRIAERTGYSTRTVKRTLRGLEEARYIVREANARQHRPTQYRLPQVSGDMTAPLRRGQGRHQGLPGVTSTTPSGVTVTPEPVRNMSKNPPDEYDLMTGEEARGFVLKGLLRYKR
jgi:hypothetical protein